MTPPSAAATTGLGGAGDRDLCGLRRDVGGFDQGEMTSDEVVCAAEHRPHLWLFVRAPFFGARATGAEATTRRWRDGRGQLTLQWLGRALRRVRIGNRNGCQQRRGVRMRRPRVEL